LGWQSDRRLKLVEVLLTAGSLLGVFLGFTLQYGGPIAILEYRYLITFGVLFVLFATLTYSLTLYWDQVVRPKLAGYIYTISSTMMALMFSALVVTGLVGGLTGIATGDLPLAIVITVVIIVILGGLALYLSKVLSLSSFSAPSVGSSEKLGTGDQKTSSIPSSTTVTVVSSVMPLQSKPPLIQIPVAGRVIQLGNLGSPLLEDFFELYRCHFTNTIFDPASLFMNSFAFFDANCQNPQVLDSYFENYTPLWTELMDDGKYIEAARLIAAFPLHIAYGWESSTKKVLHKGTPYYFIGVSKVASDDYDEGFLYFHQALEEDKRTYKVPQPRTPAYAFVTLDPKLIQFFQGRVLQVSDYLASRIEIYRKERSGKLTLDEFKKRFLADVHLQEAVFYFVLLLHKLLAHSVLNERLKKNTLASLHDTALLFSLLLVIDDAIRNKDSNQGDKLFRQFLVYLAKKCNPLLAIGDRDLAQLTGDFERDFQKTLEAILGSKYTPSSGITLVSIEEDVAIAHGLRNFGAHRIEYQSSIVDNFDLILQRLFNLLFFSVEQLYS
jgi:hypothetical protein